MKKLFYLLFIISIGNFSCGRICACSPTMAELYLAIINDNEDLLNPNTKGYFSKDQIKIILKRKNGQEVPVDFKINPPIDFGKFKLEYYQLKAEKAATLVYQDFEVYLTLPNRPPVLMKIIVRKDGRKLEQLTIDGVNTKRLDNLPINTLFYYTL